jgi:hypothetical protein
VQSRWWDGTKRDNQDKEGQSRLNNRFNSVLTTWTINVKVDFQPSFHKKEGETRNASCQRSSSDAVIIESGRDLDNNDVRGSGFETMTVREAEWMTVSVVGRQGGAWTRSARAELFLKFAMCGSGFDTIIVREAEWMTVSVVGRQGGA